MKVDRRMDDNDDRQISNTISSVDDFVSGAKNWVTGLTDEDNSKICAAHPCLTISKYDVVCDIVCRNAACV